MNTETLLRHVSLLKERIHTISHTQSIYNDVTWDEIDDAIDAFTYAITREEQ